MSRLIKYPLVNQLPILDTFQLEFILHMDKEKNENFKRIGIKTRYATPDDQEKNDI